MATFCQNCGTQNEENSLFCASCGAKQPNTTEQQQAAPLQPAAQTNFTQTSPPNKKKSRLKKFLVIASVVVVLAGLGTLIGLYYTGEIGFPVDSYVSDYWNEDKPEIRELSFRAPRGLAALSGTLSCEIDVSTDSRQRKITINPTPKKQDASLLGDDMYIYPDPFKSGEYITVSESFIRTGRDDVLSGNLPTPIVHVSYDFKLNRQAEKGGQYDGCYRLELMSSSYHSYNDSDLQNKNYFAVLYIKKLENGKTVIYRDGLSELII